MTGGFGAEVVARVAESGVPLRVPPRRIGLPDVRVPAAPHLSAAVLPTAERVTSAAQQMVDGALVPSNHA